MAFAYINLLISTGENVQKKAGRPGIGGSQRNRQVVAALCAHLLRACPAVPQPRHTHTHLAGRRLTRVGAAGVYTESPWAWRSGMSEQMNK